ncbi:thiamine phosphate synthase [Teichococcus vastitatis]|jgi:thiamine-phosphate pyrophosphorylase|uniref:Thiamine phosphate synthase n=1 Tax=Teichococcus vastitatis TaxID=2307076 RepID=A0ABS9W5D4_9PROT|nr:thiamine phosphate synthase [Pseudoroseomonas vastitatis]MCI0754507.1 thiamine phosphate synthase [Pseudoroseomonas vastitatis]
MMLPTRFYPVVPDAGWVRRVARAGARFVQLRLKDAAEDEIRRQAAAADAACRATGAVLVLNDHWRVAIELGLPWLHLGQEDLLEADLAAIRAAGLRFGVSTHSEAELELALAAGPDYVALGPVYPTTLKKMPWAPQGLARLGTWKRRIGALPLVAIGGISLERAAGCLAAGADAVAVVSDVVGHPAPEQRVAEWTALDG